MSYDSLENILESYIKDFSFINFTNDNSNNIFNSIDESQRLWAAGLEMEATYVLNPLDTDTTWEEGLKQFYIVDMEKIIDYIENKYGSSSNKYKYIYEAEVSGRKCAGKTVISPDPRHSMLEIATDTPYLKKKSIENIYETPKDLLYYSDYLIDIQNKAIQDLNNFYHKENLWTNPKKYYSIVPYPYAMSDRLKNADIVLGDKCDTENKTNYTGSYHFTLTLPFQIYNYNEELYFLSYKRYINNFQWIEPLIIALYTTTDMRGIGSKEVYSRASYRILLSGWGNPGGSDVRKFNEGLTRKVNIPLYWREGINYPGKEKLEKYCADPNRKYNDDYVDPNRDIYDMGGDFRTPSGFHGESWSVRNRPKGKYFGVEMRILDYFPPRHMASLLRIIAHLLQNSRLIENKMYVYEDKDWIKAMHSVFESGWRAKLPIQYINKLEKALELKFPKKPTMLSSFMDVFLNELFKKNKGGDCDYLPLMFPDEKDKEPLVKRNPNRESWDFGFLLKLNESKKTRDLIQNLFETLPINKNISLNQIKNHYKKKMPIEWKNNMIDIIYFFSTRDGLTIIQDKDGFIKNITINKIQNNNISVILENYIGSIVRLWPELVQYNIGKKL